MAVDRARIGNFKTHQKSHLSIMKLIDTHTHLYVSEFDEDRDDVINDAIHSGIEKFFLPNIDLDSVDGMHELVEKYPKHCFPMMGLHPCSVNENYKSTLNDIEAYLNSAKTKYYAIGEIGIDLYWDNTFLEAQIEAFKTQIQWAKRLKLPIVIHVRDAFDEVFSVIDELNDEDLFGIFHCFTGSVEQANKVINYGGFMLGIGGVLTFKNAGLDSVIKEIELDYLVLETDSPYLAPVPKRGKRNESKYLINIAQKLAEVHGLTIEEVAEITTRNANSIFRIPTT